MRAVAYQQPSFPVSSASLNDIDLPVPKPAGRDLLVEVKAVAINPVDTKVRSRRKPDDGEWVVLGWDVAGVVTAVGPDATDFKVGDQVYYAGHQDRQGGNAQYQCVDERIVARKPARLTFPEAAALPLTMITAWEMLFDRLEIERRVAGQAPVILIVGGAGGVSSAAIQLVRQMTDLKIIATASSSQSREWVESMGAHFVVDHSKPLAEQVIGLGLGEPSFIFSTTMTDRHVGELAKVIAPQGRFGLIDDPDNFDVGLFKRKAASIHWEYMFVRPLFATPDVAEVGRLLGKVADMIDAGALRTTLGENLGPINAENLIRGHAMIEAGRVRGKLVLEGFALTAKEQVANA